MAGCLASLNITSGIEYGKGILHFLLSESISKKKPFQKEKVREE
jgi:hypothetical protein